MYSTFINKHPTADYVPGCVEVSVFVSVGAVKYYFSDALYCRIYIFILFLMINTKLKISNITNNNNLPEYLTVYVTEVFS